MNRNSKKYRIKSKFRFITFIVIVLAVSIGLFGYITGLNISTASTIVEYTEIEISDGDTLWEIAKQYKEDNTDTRKAVYEICQLNSIKAADLKPGMQIKVPTDI